ncbi:MAG: hypothetical protein AAFN93_17645, partial [Bacteroidota bacterium]
VAHFVDNHFLLQMSSIKKKVFAQPNPKKMILRALRIVIRVSNKHSEPVLIALYTCWCALLLLGAIMMALMW